MYTTDSLVNKVTKDLLKQKENLLMEQLNDFVSRGLIVIEETAPSFIKEDDLLDPSSYKITLRQTVRLVLKDKEYIEKLEAENKELKESVKQLEANIKGITYLKEKFKL